MAGLLAAATPHLNALKAGAFAFGAVIGWNTYFINRYGKDVVIGDLAGSSRRLVEARYSRSSRQSPCCSRTTAWV
jgi:hypothetical protein